MTALIDEPEVTEEDGDIRIGSRYYFAVAVESRNDGFMNNIIDVAIVEREEWEETGYLSDQPQDIELFLMTHRIETPNETSNFWAYGYEDAQSVITLLESLGLVYSNDLASKINDEEWFDTRPCYIKP